MDTSVILLINNILWFAGALLIGLSIGILLISKGQ